MLAFYTFCGIVNFIERPFMAELRSPGWTFECLLRRNFLVTEGEILKLWILQQPSAVNPSKQTLKSLTPAAITDPKQTLRFL